MSGLTGRVTTLAADGGHRAALLAGLVDLEVFYETHDAPLPDDPVLHIRVPGGSDGERQAGVDAIAEALGVHAQWRDRVYMAARSFGPLTVEAHVTTQARTRSAAAAVPRRSHKAVAG